MSLPRKCVIVPAMIVTQRLKEFFPPSEWYMLPAGAAVCGMHFDLILFVDGWDILIGERAGIPWARHISTRVVDKRNSVIIGGPK